MSRVFLFIGVTTGHSAIMRIFPRWRDLLGLGADVEIVGRDMPVHAPPAHYRALVSMMKEDANILGGLVTTHKLDLYTAARDLIDDVDWYAQVCAEVSCLAKRDDRLLGWAKDPVAAGRTLAGMLGPGYFARTGAKALCFGAGGAGTAIALHLLTASAVDGRPAGIIVTDRAAARVNSLRALDRKIASAIPFEVVENSDPRVNDALMRDLPPGSLVINATGMGKDIPGTPVTNDARFPERGIAWDLNYRGILDFMSQAAAQRDDRGVQVEDGWGYFIQGWAAALEEVFQRPVGDQELDRMAEAAAFARPALSLTMER